MTQENARWELEILLAKKYSAYRGLEYNDDNRVAELRKFLDSLEEPLYKETITETKPVEIKIEESPF